MSLAAGTRLGPYELVTAIGAGGMGEVYKARDTRLDRIVAIKVLPADVAADPDFRQRFEREARTVAALNHPHICTLHDIGQQDGIDFLVMEYLEGETLAERLKKGSLPIDQALRDAIEIADALDKAHRQGIVHRDLKPGNIMLTKSGTKLLDFGLARIRAGGASMAGGLAWSAVPTEQGLTAQGTILGTLQYMAPEQLEGKEADARTDIFAFGAVVYEMTTGKKAFEGKSQASLIAAILDSEPPPIPSLQPLAPPLLDHVVKRCLAKDPDDRWQAASDVMRELKWIAEVGSHGASAASPAHSASRRRERLAWISVSALLTLIAAVAIVLAVRPAPPAPEVRLDITTPPTTDPLSLAISPDGQKIIFAATSEGRSQLWLRSLDSVSAQPLAGTEGGSYPFWSPDSRSMGFFADGQLKRIDVDGGSLQVLANAVLGWGGTWNRDGTILFAPNSASPIFRIAPPGGEPVVLTRLDLPQQTRHRFPQFLPDGRHFLYYVQGAPDVRGVYVAQLGGSETRRVLDADAAAVYAPSGQLLFVRQSTLFAQNFDPVRVALTGNPFPVAEQVGVSAGAGLAALSVSAAGSVVFRTGSEGGQRQFMWFDRSGKEIGKVGDPDSAGSTNPAISADGRRVALQRVVNGNNDIWLLDLGRGVLSRFTFDGATDFFATWSPDGSRVAFGSNRNSTWGLYQKLATGAGNEELLLTTTQTKAPTAWSPDGRFLLYRSTDPKMSWDIWALPLDGDRKPFPVVRTNFEERDGQFSPDGKWIAYQSNESGRFEIYAQAFPGPGGKFQISTSGGAQVRWRRDGKELFYIALDGRLMAVPVQFASDGQAVEVGAPIPLFATRVGGALQGVNKQQYIVSPDGQRFLMNTVIEEATSPITVILNWKAKP